MGSRRGGEGGSGAAVGVAMMFPVLMLVIVLIQMPSDTTRAEQAPQATTNRAARVAALRCYQIDGAGGAATARAGLKRATDAPADNQTHCNNDLASDADVVSIERPAPPGGNEPTFSAVSLLAEAATARHGTLEEP